jgi:hypothetical protein
LQERGEKVIKFIIYSVIAYFVISFIKSLLSATKSNPTTAAKSGSASRSTDNSLMIRCSACGTFVTQGSAIAIGNSRFCSNACAGVRAQKA